MKSLFFLQALLLTLFSAAQKVELQSARFKTGDDKTFSYPVTDDSKWVSLRTGLNWDNQYEGQFREYDGYAWYRFHLFFPEILRQRSYMKDSLRIFIGRVDDVCEVFLNGTRIGRSGSFPEDPGGYKTTWNKPVEIHISANDPLFKWGGDNIIAVRVYDGGGPGGLFGQLPYVNMIDLVDGIMISNSASLKKSSNEKMTKEVVISNNNPQPVSGVFRFSIINFDKENAVDDSLFIRLKPFEKIKKQIPIDANGRNTIRFSFIESHSGKTKEVSEVIPYILTPAPAQKPKINGAGVYGVRPGSPFLYKIPATGKKPLIYAAENLPAGLSIDPKTGVIRGQLKTAGDFPVTFVVSNAFGTIKRSFLIKCGNQLALTPPMGWNSWNCWGLSVSDEKLRSSARALIDKGLIDHGWAYMNIDDGWEAATRNGKGEILANQKFPDMKKLGDWLHANGLKFGIYSSPGPTTCGGYLGSYQHEEQDAATYAKWGIDYLKYDWCSYDDIHDKKDESLESYKKPYQLMQEALKKQNRDIVYSLCQYGMKNVWEWGASVGGNTWRTTGDITDTWESLSGIGFGQTVQFPYAGPGHWNDPDMMILGQVGWGENLHPTRLTVDEQYTHVSLWCLLNAPLLIGCDISKLDDFTLGLLTNDEVIAVNQDLLGKQAQRVMSTDTYQVWIKDMADGTKVLGIFNLLDKDDVVRFYWNNLKLGDNYHVRDLWRQKDIGRFPSMYATKVAAHGVTLIKIEPFQP